MDLCLCQDNFCNNMLKKKLLILLYYNRHLRRPQRSVWVREIFKKRRQQGDYHNLIQEMRLGDKDKHFNYFRMSSQQFDELLGIVSPYITKQHCVREPISAGERLALTLRYLASGDSMVSMSYAFRLGKNTVSKIINETCDVLWNSLQKDVLKIPSEDIWLQISDGFEKQWHLPHCIGALDGKHIIIQAPPNAGSQFFNYKHTHSIILMALCDANYQFIVVDIGAQGRQSDGGVFRLSKFGNALITKNLQLPPPSAIEYGGADFPYFIVGDEAFPLMENLMRPFPGHFLSQEKRIFNYRLSRGRRVIENAFGILAARWRIIRKPILASLDTIEKITKSIVCLHNWLMMKRNRANLYCPVNFVDTEDETGHVIEGEWRVESHSLRGLGRTSTNTYKKNASVIRNEIASYFMFDGSVPFQWDK